MRLESSLLHANEVRSCKNQQQQRSCVCMLSDMNALIKTEMLININLFIGATFITFQRRKMRFSLRFVSSNLCDSRIVFSLPIRPFIQIHNSPSKWVTLFSGKIGLFNGGIDFQIIQSRRPKTQSQRLQQHHRRLVAGISNFPKITMQFPNEPVLIMNE